MLDATEPGSIPLRDWEGLAQSCTQDEEGQNYIVGHLATDREAFAELQERVKYLRKLRKNLGG